MKHVLVLLAALACALGGLTASAQAADGDVFADWSISPSTVYPTGQNGTRDDVNVWWASHYLEGGDPTVSIQVTASDGSSVLSQDFGPDPSGSW